MSCLCPLKTGSRVGELCGVKASGNTKFCKRHAICTTLKNEIPLQFKNPSSQIPITRAQAPGPVYHQFCNLIDILFPERIDNKIIEDVSKNIEIGATPTRISTSITFLRRDLRGFNDLHPMNVEKNVNAYIREYKIGPGSIIYTGYEDELKPFLGFGYVRADGSAQINDTSLASSFLYFNEHRNEFLKAPAFAKCAISLLECFDWLEGAPAYPQ
jgi:hypothetical protein